MKIYTKVVFDMETLETLSEESFEYSGPLALCGGGPSGTIDYNTDIKSRWMDMYGNATDFEIKRNGTTIASNLASNFQGIFQDDL